ncbi:MAG: aminotransferase [Vicingaceae bacterium]|nr:MAG: aminotransferase [Vicingaceae bacterium]
MIESNKLSERMSLLNESQTLWMTRKSRELKAQGYDVVNLSIGEPDFDTPDFIKQAAIDAIHNNITHYPPVNGFPELREAISRKFLRDNNIHFHPNQILVSTGAKQSLINAILALCDKNDEVLLPAPYWVSYIEMVKMAEAKPVIIPTTIETDFKVTPEQLEKYITSRTKLIIFSSPCNPSGSFYTKEELEAWAEVLKKYPNVLVISDEIYEHINFESNHFSLASLDEMYERTITVNGVSKSFAMTGWRIGYLGAPQWITDAANKIQGQFTSGACSISQMAALAAVDADPGPVVKPMVKEFKKRRDFLIEKLSAIEGLKVNRPPGAFYIFPDVSRFLGNRFKTSNELVMYILEKFHVALVSGDAFGNPDCVRISYATSMENLKKAIDRLTKAFEELS